MLIQGGEFLLDTIRFFLARNVLQFSYLFSPLGASSLTARAEEVKISTTSTLMARQRPRASLAPSSTVKTISLSNGTLPIIAKPPVPSRSPTAFQVSDVGAQ